LQYPGKNWRPEDLLDFIELKCFTRRWKEIGLDDEGDLTALQLAIMTDPKGCPPIQGTHGMRKLRFAPPRWKTGKSGAARVLYVYFEEFGIVLLCFVFKKGEADTISPNVKKYLNQLIAEQEQELRRRKSL